MTTRSACVHWNKPSDQLATLSSDLQVDLKKCGFRRDRLLAIPHHACLERFRLAMNLRRHLLAPADMPVHGTFTAKNL